MKKMITMVVLVSLICIGSTKVFAQHWRCPSGVEIEDPAPMVFQNDLM